MLVGGAVSWHSKLQEAVALSTTESELITDSSATRQAVWIAELLREHGYQQQKVTLQIDNNGPTDITVMRGKSNLSDS